MPYPGLFTSEVKITRVSNAEAAATTDIETTVVDMAGFEGITWVVGFGTITGSAVTSIKAQQGAESDLSDAADLEGTGVTVADDDDNQTKYLEVKHVQERYCRLVVDRGTQNAVVDGVWAFQYGPRKKPITQPTAVEGEAHVAPAEGTA